MSYSDITSTLAIVGTLIGLYFIWRKAPHEENNIDAEAAKVHEEAATLASARANALEKELASVKRRLREVQLLLDELTGRDANLQSRVTALENENNELKRLIRYLQNEIDERDGALEQVKKWAEMLVFELKRNNLPVPAMPEKTQPRKAQ